MYPFKKNKKAIDFYPFTAILGCIFMKEWNIISFVFARGKECALCFVGAWATITNRGADIPKYMKNYRFHWFRRFHRYHRSTILFFRFRRCYHIFHVFHRYYRFHRSRRFVFPVFLIQLIFVRVLVTAKSFFELN